MQKPKIQILSTRDLPADIIQLAAENDIDIDCVTFIETKSVVNDETGEKIKQLASADEITTVFTSMNAVEAVAEIVNKDLNWNVYCIGYATKHLVKEKLKAVIKGEADDAASLADVIINNNEQEVYFFSGEKRRDELPNTLKASGIHINEIIVYSTTLINHKINKRYDAILFYSPSAVESFFSENKVDPETVFFAIGKTTAAAILNYTHNKIILAEQPGKVELALTMIQYFSNKKKKNEHIKK
jgi:uroporphyrinogen-III synthase